MRGRENSGGMEMMEAPSHGMVELKWQVGIDAGSDA